MLTIVARIVAKDGKSADLETALRGLIPPTRKEEGCVQYDLHRSVEDSNIFLFYELWKSKPDWESHMEKPHLQEFLSQSPEWVADLEVFQMERIDPA